MLSAHQDVVDTRLLPTLGLIAGRLRVERDDPIHPLPYRRIARMRLPQFVQVAQQMHPAALVLPAYRVVAAVEVADHHALKRLPEHFARHQTRSAPIIEKVAQCRRRKTPEIAVLAVFAPAGLVGMHERTAAHLIPKLLAERLTTLCDPLQHGRDLSSTDRDPIKYLQ